MTLGVATLAEEAVRYMMQLELETFDFEAVRSVGLVLSQQNSLAPGNLPVGPVIYQ